MRLVVIAIAAAAIDRYDRVVPDAAAGPVAAGMREDKWSLLQRKDGAKDSGTKDLGGEGASGKGGGEKLLEGQDTAKSLRSQVDALVAENLELRAEAGLEGSANLTDVNDKLSKRMATLKEVNHLLTVQRDKERQVFADRDVVAAQAAEMLRDTMAMPFGEEATPRQKAELALASAMAEQLQSTPFLTSHARAASKGEYAQIAADNVGAVEQENEQIRKALEAAGGPAPDDSQALIDRMRDLKQENRELKANVELRRQIQAQEEENARLQAQLEKPPPGAPAPQEEVAALDSGLQKTAAKGTGGLQPRPDVHDLNSAYKQVIEGLQDFAPPAADAKSAGRGTH